MAETAPALRLRRGSSAVALQRVFRGNAGRRKASLARHASEVADLQESHFRLRRRLLKLLATTLIIVLLFVFGSWVGTALKALRAQAKTLPMWPVIVAALLIDAVRKLFPPAYYMFPFGTLLAMYWADTKGPYLGAAIYQTLKLPQAFYFMVQVLY